MAKNFMIISLCSYLCYNSSDAAGAESEVIARDLAKSGKAPNNSCDYAASLRNINDTSSWAYELIELNRDICFWAEAMLIK